MPRCATGNGMSECRRSCKRGRVRAPTPTLTENQGDQIHAPQHLLKIRPRTPRTVRFYIHTFRTFYIVISTCFSSAQYGLAGNLSKIIQSLPPQIRDNPAALAQLMHTNPLLGLQAGLHQNPLMAAQTGVSPLSSLFKLQEEQDEKEKLNETIREQSKPHALNLLQQQQVHISLKQYFPLELV